MKTIEKYECNECCEIHDDAHDAAYCCPQYIVVYACGHCHKNFRSDEKLADECCEDVDSDAEPMITHAQLEAAGQLRLDCCKQ